MTAKDWLYYYTTQPYYTGIICIKGDRKHFAISHPNNYVFSIVVMRLYTGDVGLQFEEVAKMKVTKDKLTCIKISPGSLCTHESSP